jgi:hypothetical protein
MRRSLEREFNLLHSYIPLLLREEVRRRQKSDCQQNLKTKGKSSMPLSFSTASPSSTPEEMWTTVFNELSQRIRPYFVRPESHHRALAYMQGLMSAAERKNGWQVSEEVGDATPCAMQHLLDRAKWDYDRVRDELQMYVRETLATTNGILVGVPHIFAPSMLKYEIL